MFKPAAQIVRSSVGAALLLLVVTACADSTTASSADSTAPPEATAVVTTDAVASTVAPTTSPATTTTAPRTIVAVGTWTNVQGTFGAVKLPSGDTGLTELLVLDGDLVGSVLYDVGVSPVGATGLVTAYADGTFRGTMAGVGEGTLAWSEPEADVTLPAAPGTVPMVGASGDFLGAHGTYSWTYNPDGDSGTYEVRLVWD